MTFNTDITDFFKGAPPAVSKSYELPKKGGKLNIAAKDLVNFQKLYPVKSKAGGFTVGNGELATFYLFNFQRPKNPSSRAQENRGGEAADLIIDKKKVEVKAYPYKTGGADKKVGLGRFGQYRAFREMMSTMFAVDNIMRGGSSFVDLQNFSYKDIKSAGENLCMMREVLFNKPELMKIEFLKKLSENIKRFDKIAKEEKISSICYKRGQPRPGGDKMAIAISKYILKKMFAAKPGDGGYMLNIGSSKSDKTKFDEEAGLVFTKIDVDNIDEEAIATETPQNFTFAGGKLEVRINNLFPLR
mgnify:CR=1 FL=1